MTPTGTNTKPTSAVVSDRLSMGISFYENTIQINNNKPFLTVPEKDNENSRVNTPINENEDGIVNLIDKFSTTISPTLTSPVLSRKISKSNINSFDNRINTSIISDGITLNFSQKESCLEVPSTTDIMEKLGKSRNTMKVLSQLDKRHSIMNQADIFNKK